MGSRKHGPLKHKNHAQDCETLTATHLHQRPAILPWSLYFEWRPSFRWYGHPTRYRPAAGLLLDTPHSEFAGNPATNHAKTRANNARVNFLTTNVVFLEQRL